MHLKEMNYSDELQSKTTTSSRSTQTNNMCPDCVRAVGTQRNILPGGIHIWGESPIAYQHLFIEYLLSASHG